MPIKKRKPFRVYTRNDLGGLLRLAGVREDEIALLEGISAVLPFRVNNHVVEDLIDWAAIPDDPLYQLTFPQPAMLEEAEAGRMAQLVESGASESALRAAAWEIQQGLNPHPEGQMFLNVPLWKGAPLAGVQHKYRETVLFFPSAGQTCHAYCTYCFRWPQFVGIEGLRFASKEVSTLIDYLASHPEVSDVLFTGGDPLSMKTKVLRRYIEPLLTAGLDGVDTIRIGTKAPAYWPYRFVMDDDADDLLRLFEEVIAAGKHLAFMAHYSHPRELEHPVAQEALRRIRDTGAVVRSQAPVIEHVNNDWRTWADLWRLQVRLGVVPYYLFVERDTGPRSYFEVPLLETLDVFTTAYRSLSGIARTVRGPCMSTTHGKIVVSGTAVVEGSEVLVLQYVQARDAELVGRPFFARADCHATWFDQLQPADVWSESFFNGDSPVSAHGALNGGNLLRSG